MEALLREFGGITYTMAQMPIVIPAGIRPRTCPWVVPITSGGLNTNEQVRAYLFSA